MVAGAEVFIDGCRGDPVPAVPEQQGEAAWAPRITKLGAVYRAAAIPVMDGYVGMAFGSRRDDLSVKVQRFGLNRQEWIAAIVRAMAVYLRDHRDTVAQLRALVSPTVLEPAAAPAPELAPLIPDLRLLDMVVWTAMDDRIAARAGRSPRWLGRPIGAHIPVEAVAPEPIHTAGDGAGGKPSSPLSVGLIHLPLPRRPTSPWPQALTTSRAGRRTAAGSLLGLRLLRPRYHPKISNRTTVVAFVDHEDSLCCG